MIFALAFMVDALKWILDENTMMLLIYIVLNAS